MVPDVWALEVWSVAVAVGNAVARAAAGKAAAAGQATAYQ